MVSFHRNTNSLFFYLIGRLGNVTITGFLPIVGSVRRMLVMNKKEKGRWSNGQPNFIVANDKKAAELHYGQLMTNKCSGPFAPKCCAIKMPADKCLNIILLSSLRSGSLIHNYRHRVDRRLEYRRHRSKSGYQQCNFTGQWKWWSCTLARTSF